MEYIQKKQPFFYTFINIDVRLQDLNLQSSDYEPDEITNFSKTAVESIQPQVPLRLPCYDFTPVTKQSSW